MLLDDSLLLSDYRAHQSAAGLRPVSIQQEGYVLSMASRWLISRRRKTLGTADALDLTAYMAAGMEERKPATMRTHYANLLSLYRWREAMDGGANPMRKVPRPKADRPIPRALSERDVDDLLGSIYVGTWQGLRDRAFLQVLRGCGLRVGECARLQLGDVGLQERTILVRTSKTRRARLVPMGRETAQWISRWLERREETATESVDLWVSSTGREMRSTSWVARCRALGRDMGVTAHVLRHTCATHMLDHGANIRQVQELLGHTSILSTQIYTRVTLSGMREALERVPGA